MSLRRVSSEVLVARGSLMQASAADIQQLKAGALSNERKRMRICAHPENTDRLHEMLIAMARQTYVRPHRHLNKSESVHVIEGTARVVIFKDDGAIHQVIPLGDFASGRTFFYRMAAPEFHTLLIDSDVLIVHETTNGPFERADTIFAPWAPDESDLAARATYTEQLRRAADSSHP
jgi:cupin fold WbuC family metalloprotein